MTQQIIGVIEANELVGGARADDPLQAQGPGGLSNALEVDTSPLTKTPQDLTMQLI